MILWQPHSQQPMTRVLLFLLAFSLSFVLGCKKQQQTKQLPPSTADEAVAPAAPAAVSKQSAAAATVREKLPGASVVRDDLKNKNYSKAVEGLLVLRGFAANEEQWVEYRELNAEVGQTLAADAQTDANAAKALASYRLAVYGR